ncbi:DUF1311 domain-containing protein [Roseivivax marinus]|uniref:lysozyme inhibitor LprI family protein n=1 Tax=Roseivivax marinus TaxID=1379903 RepID=UPI001F03AA17|nr:lysozyme inhibitor LprI family protein [Roseivivax marinus]UMA65653.1 DUF1311 domain-containing protein [Roseivivax marinus]
MIRLLAALCLLALPTPLPAQGARAPSQSEVGALESCIASQSRGGPPAQVAKACSGLIADRCPDDTTIGISQCLQTETAAWDTLLNRWWGPMRANAQRNGTWDRLLADQRAWISRKEAACAAVYEEWKDGSIRTIMAASCLRDWTAEKTAEFYAALHR